MKANELRIGNFYNHNGEVKQITPNTILEVFEAERIWCKPLKLTQEWLLKLGFTTKGNYDNFILNDLEIASSVRVISTNERSSFYTFFGDEHILNSSVNFVHELQNLYFALFGEELTTI